MSARKSGQVSANRKAQNRCQEHERGWGGACVQSCTADEQGLPCHTGRTPAPAAVMQKSCFGGLPRCGQLGMGSLSLGLGLLTASHCCAPATVPDPHAHAPPTPTPTLQHLNKIIKVGRRPVGYKRMMTLVCMPATEPALAKLRGHRAGKHSARLRPPCSLPPPFPHPLPSLCPPFPPVHPHVHADHAWRARAARPAHGHCRHRL